MREVLHDIVLIEKVTLKFRYVTNAQYFPFSDAWNAKCITAYKSKVVSSSPEKWRLG
jgi:hypothetical protein